MLAAVEEHRELQGVVMTCRAYEIPPGAEQPGRCLICGAPFVQSRRPTADRQTYGYTPSEPSGADPSSPVWICKFCFDRHRESFRWRTPAPSNLERFDPVIDRAAVRILEWLKWHITPH